MSLQLIFDVLSTGTFASANYPPMFNFNNCNLFKRKNACMYKIKYSVLAFP